MFPVADASAGPAATLANIARPSEILAVADGFDAMSHERAYRPRRSAAEVQRILRDEAGRQWDARVVAAAFDTWVELASIQDRGLGTSLRFAVEKALPQQDSTSFARAEQCDLDDSMARTAS